MNFTTPKEARSIYCSNDNVFHWPVYTAGRNVWLIHPVARARHNVHMKLLRAARRNDTIGNREWYSERNDNSFRNRKLYEFYGELLQCATTGHFRDAWNGDTRIPLYSERFSFARCASKWASQSNRVDLKSSPEYWKNIGHTRRFSPRDIALAD